LHEPRIRERQVALLCAFAGVVDGVTVNKDSYWTVSSSWCRGSFSGKL
jgi:hypothetical protein